MRALALALALAGCGGARANEPTPVAMLAGSQAAQDAMRPLLDAFAHGSDADRLAAEAPLGEVVRRYPDDDLARVATAHLAWIALERGQLERAVELARKVEAGPAGTTRNLAVVIEGGALRREGRPAEALTLLVPLVGKLVDGYARALLDEEVIRAALSARRWELAVRTIATWLGEAGEEDAEAVGEKVEQLVDAIPPEELAALLEAPRGPAAEGDAVRGLLVQRLAAVAVQRKDAPLAKRLLAIARQLLGARGDAVAELAAGATAARVEPRRVGLLLSLRSDETRRRGVEVAAGLALGLGLPGSPARLASRDDHGALEGAGEALASLSADGAAVLVAGVDEAEATAAARFADANEVPVLLLRPPAGGAGARFGFVIGDDPRAVGEALVAALAKRGGAPAAWIGEGAPAGTPGAGAVAFGLACGEPWPLAAFQRAGGAGLLLMGSPSCARDAIAAAGGTGLRLAFGLDAGEAARPGALVASAGQFPPARAADSKGAPPGGWWAALGRDAGVLAWAAVRGLPATGTEDPAEVRARRAAVAAALARVEVALWTTEATGFAGGRALARRISVREAR